MQWVGWSLAALLCACCVLLAVTVLRQRRRRRGLERRLAELERRPAVVSHEIRTPLALVRGAAELLAEGRPGPLTPVQDGFVNVIADNTQVAIDLAENLLTVAKIDSGGFTADLEPVDVRAVVSECVREIRRILGTPIRVEASGGVLPVVTDENKVRQMVWNLVNNAARHAGAEATMTISVRTGADGGCTIAVSDDGPGMSHADREVLFTPFTTGTGRRPGTGLGMMVVKRIAEGLGGRVMVDTEEGAGTAIMVRLPARAPEAR